MTLSEKEKVYKSIYSSWFFALSFGMSVLLAGEVNVSY